MNTRKKVIAAGTAVTTGVVGITALAGAGSGHAVAGATPVSQAAPLPAISKPATVNPHFLAADFNNVVGGVTAVASVAAAAFAYTANQAAQAATAAAGK